MRRLLLCVVGCAGPGPGTKSPSTSPTDSALPATASAPAPEYVVGELPEGADLCAFEATAPEVPDTTTPPTPLTPPTGYVLESAPYTVPCMDGRFYVRSMVVDYGGTRYDDHLAALQLFAFADLDLLWIEGSELDPLAGSDDCGLTETGSNGLGYGGDTEYADGGAATIDASFGQVDLDPTNGVSYSADLAALGIPAAFDADYGLTTAGSDGIVVPGWGRFDGSDPVVLPGVLHLPRRLDLTLPSPFAPGGVLPRADVDLVWTGTSSGLVGIELFALDGTAYDPRRYTLTCEVVDDGAFTVPGALLAAIPAGYVAQIRVTRANQALIGTSWGRAYRVLGETGYTTAGFTLQ